MGVEVILSAPVGIGIMCITLLQMYDTFAKIQGKKQIKRRVEPQTALIKI